MPPTQRGCSLCFREGKEKIHTAAQAKSRLEPAGLALVCSSQLVKLVVLVSFLLLARVFPSTPVGSLDCKLKHFKWKNKKTKNTKKKQLKDLCWSPGKKVGKDKKKLLAWASKNTNWTEAVSWQSESQPEAHQRDGLGFPGSGFILNLFGHTAGHSGIKYHQKITSRQHSRGIGHRVSCQVNILQLWYDYRAGSFLEVQRMYLWKQALTLLQWPFLLRSCKTNTHTYVCMHKQPWNDEMTQDSSGKYKGPSSGNMSEHVSSVTTFVFAVTRWAKRKS